MQVPYWVKRLTESKPPTIERTTIKETTTRIAIPWEVVTKLVTDYAADQVGLSASSIEAVIFSENYVSTDPVIGQHVSAHVRFNIKL